MGSNDLTPETRPPAIEGIITMLSPLSVEETLERLQTTISSRGLSVLAHINHSGEAALNNLLPAIRSHQH